MLIRRLADLTAADLGAAGGKGANLGELMRAGFPVPDGFLLTTEAYARASREAAVDSRAPEEARARLGAQEVPREIADEARAFYRGARRDPRCPLHRSRLDAALSSRLAAS